VAQNYSFDLDQGTTWSISCQYKDFSCTPIDITGATFTGKARLATQSGAVTATFTIAITSGANGQFTVSLTAANTAAMVAGTHVYDIEMVLAGVTYRMFEGFINVRAEATY
jgi:hypothetical protein